MDPTAFLNGTRLNVAAAKLSGVTARFQHVTVSVAAASGPDTIIGGAFTEDLQQRFAEVQVELAYATTCLTLLAGELEAQAITETAKGIAL